MSHEPAFAAGAGGDLPAAGMQRDLRRRQILMSPYHGRPDFSALTEDYTASARVDLVSVADLLRNGFVYAPHSIFEDVKLVTFGFDPAARHAHRPRVPLSRSARSGRREQQADARHGLGRICTTACCATRSSPHAARSALHGCCRAAARIPRRSRSRRRSPPGHPLHHLSWWQRRERGRIRILRRRSPRPSPRHARVRSRPGL